MKLILEVVAQNGQPSPGEPRKVFGVEGGRIGRASDCEWVLPSPYISRHHATVCWDDGIFYIVSTGENGVALNDAEVMLPMLEHHALRSGDRLSIDGYEICVAVTEAAPLTLSNAPPPTTTPGSTGALHSTAVVATAADKSAVASADARYEATTEELSIATAPSLRTALGLDPARKFAALAEPPTHLQVRETAWNHSSSLSDHFVPPPVASAHLSLPADWNNASLPASPMPLKPVQSALPTAPQETQPMRASGLSRLPPTDAVPLEDNTGVRPIGGSNGVFDLSTLLRGAGIEPGSLSPGTAELLGGLLRSLVQGLIEALRTRADFRKQFRLPVTRVQISENNPLKFASDPSDALLFLLRNRAGGYLGPLEAVEDACEDIRRHPQAVAIGMRAGFESVLNRFDPKRLAQEFDNRAHRSSLWPMSPCARYWRQYEDLFEILAADTNSAFRRLFGEPFAEAYERHLHSEDPS